MDPRMTQLIFMIINSKIFQINKLAGKNGIISNISLTILAIQIVILICTWKTWKTR